MILDMWPVSQNRGSSHSLWGATDLLLGITSFLRNEQLPVSMDLTAHTDVSKAKTSAPTHAMQTVGLCAGSNVSHRC